MNKWTVVKSPDPCVAPLIRDESGRVVARMNLLSGLDAVATAELIVAAVAEYQTPKDCRFCGTLTLGRPYCNEECERAHGRPLCDPHGPGTCSLLRGHTGHHQMPLRVQGPNQRRTSWVPQ